MAYAIRDLFRGLEEYTGPSILTVVIPCFVFFLGCVLEVTSKSACFPFVARDISVVLRILRFKRLDKKCPVLP
jgi:hypothetical protein